MSEPREQLEHIVRPNLPWRLTGLTECGKDAAKVTAISRDDAVRKFKRQGKIRAALSTCTTCWTTAEWNRDWATSPSEVMARWLKRRPFQSFGPTNTDLDRELRAIEALIAAHRNEFDDFVRGLEEATTIDALRQQRDRRRHQSQLHGGHGAPL